MREILFRGKRTDNGDWVHGDLSHHRDGRVFIRCWERLELDPAYNAFEVNPETVGQFTGMTDKNSKKIFEGDIVAVKLEDSNGEDWEKIMKVHYNSNECCWYPMRWNEECEFCEGWTEIKSIEVIGNIHDNPELLEVGADG